MVYVYNIQWVIVVFRFSNLFGRLCYYLYC